MRLHRAWLTMIVCCTIAAGPLAAPTRTVILRTYNVCGLPARDVQTAARTVSALLSTVAIETQWRNCAIVGRARESTSDACNDALTPNELIVRLVAGAEVPSASSSTLGYAFVDPVRKTGSLATIYADRVVDLSRALDVDRGTLLGRAIAHEAGHLLLGSQAHTAFGLMRGLWSSSAILENREGDWMFSAEQGAGMRLGLDA